MYYIYTHFGLWYCKSKHFFGRPPWLACLWWEWIWSGSLTSSLLKPPQFEGETGAVPMINSQNKSGRLYPYTLPNRKHPMTWAWLRHPSHVNSPHLQKIYMNISKYGRDHCRVSLTKCPLDAWSTSSYYTPGKLKVHGFAQHLSRKSDIQQSVTLGSLHLWQASANVCYDCVMYHVW